jgi:hypothetical protein
MQDIIDRLRADAGRKTLGDLIQEREAAANEILRLKFEADQAASRLDEAKTRLIGLASHSSEKGAGVQVTRYWKAGNVDYKKVPALEGVDLEKYRGASREEVRVTMAKQ